MLCKIFLQYSNGGRTLLTKQCRMATFIYNAAVTL